MRPRLVTVFAGVVAAAVAGCSSKSSGGTTPPVPLSPSATVTATATPSSSTTPTATPSPSASPSAVAAAPCRSTHLRLSISSGQGAAGSSYQPIVFTNTGSKPCSLYGYPGVSFVDSSGHQLGLPASHSGGSKQLVTLAGHGGTASALLQEPDPGVFSPANCKQTTASQVKVYPPNQTGALFAADPVVICTTKKGRTSVRTVVVGASGE